MPAKSAGLRAGIAESAIPTTNGFITGPTDLYFHSVRLIFATIGVFTGHFQCSMYKNYSE